MPKGISRIFLLICILLSLNTGLLAQKQTVNLGIVLDGPWERNEGILSLFQMEIENLLGRDYNLQYAPENIITSDWNREDIKAVIESLIASPQVDIVLTFGAIGSDIAAQIQYFPKPVIAPFVINVEVQHAPYVNGTSGKENFTYVAIGYNFTGALDIYKEIVPFKKIAFLWPRVIMDNIPSLANKYEHTLTETSIDNVQVSVGESADAVLRAIPADVDAVHVGILIGTPESEVDKLIQGLIDRKIPAFAHTGRSGVERGLLAGLGEGIDFQRIARRTALDIQRILSGESTKNIPVTLNRQQVLYINAHTARELNISPGWEVMTEAVLLQEDRKKVERETNLLQVTQEALTANLDIAAKQYEVEAGRQDVNSARSNLFPQIDISATGLVIDKDRAESSFGSQAERTISGKAGATQLIFSEAAWANLSIQNHLHKYCMAELHRLRLDILREAATAYLQLLTAKTLENIRKDNVSLTRSNLQRARTRQAIGISGPGEVYRWESELATSRKLAVSANANRNIAEIAVNRVVAHPAEESFSTRETDIHNFMQEHVTNMLSEYVDNKASFKIFREFLVEEAFTNSPEIDALDEAIAAKKRQLNSTTNAFWAPQLALSGEVEKIFSKNGAGSEGFVLPIEGFTAPEQDDVNWSIALNIRYPLFKGGRKFSDRKKADRELRNLQTQRKAVKDRIEQLVRSALHKAGASWAAIGFSHDAAAAAHKNLELVTDAYSRGVVSVIELLDAQNAALIADLTAANANYEFLIDVIDVQRASGKFYYLTGQGLETDFLDRLKSFYDNKSSLNQ